MYLNISIEKNLNGFHNIEGISVNYTPDGFIRVPEELVDKVNASGGYCDLVLDSDGNLTDIIPLERPAPLPPPPDPQADTDAMVVDLAYRLALLELGVSV